MFTPPELIDLFARLASNSNPTSSTSSPIQDDSLNDIISKLNNFLNFNGQSQTRVLDAALSLLGFNATRHYDSTSGFTVQTIIEFLSSSVCCKVFTIKDEEKLLVGSLISSFEAFQVVEACDGLIGALEMRGQVSEMRKIAYGAVRLMLSAPSNVSNCDDVRVVCGKSKALVKLQRYFLNDSNELPFRLLLWYLDPSLLKDDVLKILEEALRRPFLGLRKAFSENEEWRSIITCLATSPMMFIEIQGLLHRWFLETGLDTVQEVLSELISGVLSVISAPICWGLSDEIGLKLPFSIAYFPSNPSLLRNFMGPLPLSSKGVEKILSCIQKQFGHDNPNLDPLIKQNGIHCARIDDKSPWALAINFPEWFYYSCFLLFSRDIFQGNDSVEFNQAPDKALSIIAAKYISWILCPIDKSHQLALCDFLSNVSKGWVSNRERVNRIQKDDDAHRKRPKKAKHVDENDIDSCPVVSCLDKFENAFLRLSGGRIHCSVPNHSRGVVVSDRQSNLLYCRIPLFILIGNQIHVSFRECELLMHYAITGTVLLQETRKAIPTNQKHKMELNKDVTNDIDCDEAVAGIILAFQLIEFSDKLCNSAPGVEQSTIKCSLQVNITIGKYLLKCIKILVQNKFDVTQLLDIRNRLICWRQQETNLPLSCEELDSVISELNR